MNNAPIFEKSFLSPMFSVLNSDYWNTVMDIYESKKYKETVYAVLDYIKEGLSEQALDTEKTKYSLPHGSIKVNLEIKEDSIEINAPFLKIPAKSLIPLMRQVAEINFNTLVLAQIIIEGDEIFFRFNSPLELCEPYKLYRVLEEICIQADANDDVFIEKFGAQRFSQMEIEPFTEEQNDLCWVKFQEYLQEAINYADYFESKRMEYFGWDVFYMAFTKIDYFIRPQGVIKSELEKAVKDLNSHDQMNDKLAKARKATDRMIGMDKQRFTESLYKSQQFISEKPRFELTGVQNYLSKTHSTTKDEMGKKDYLGASLSMLCGIFGLLYYYNIPQTSYDLLVEGIANSSNKTWQAAAEGLWDTYEEIMNQNTKTAGNYGLRDI